MNIFDDMKDPMFDQVENDEIDVKETMKQGDKKSESN